MGLVGGSRSYDGPGIAQWAPWKCPACGSDQIGSIDAGCVSCGSGSAQARHVGVQPATAVMEKDLPLPSAAQPRQVPQDEVALYTQADGWYAGHPASTHADAYVAGYRRALQETAARIMQAPPVTADVAQLAPEGKTRRTIIAALELFKDQVLSGAAEEIVSGEWCSIEEIEQLIQQLKDEEGAHD